MPIVELKRALRDMAAGDTICVFSNDELFPEDIKSWCEGAGHEVLDVVQYKGRYEVLVKKG